MNEFSEFEIKILEVIDEYYNKVEPEDYDFLTSITYLRFLKHSNLIKMARYGILLVMKAELEKMKKNRLEILECMKEEYDTNPEIHERKFDKLTKEIEATNIGDFVTFLKLVEQMR